MVAARKELSASYSCSLLLLLLLLLDELTDVTGCVLLLKYAFQETDLAYLQGGRAEAAATPAGYGV